MSEGGALVKRCARCASVLPLSMFYKNKARRDGHGSQCRECILAAARSTRHPRNSPPRAPKTRRPRPDNAPAWYGRWGDKSLIPAGHKGCPSCLQIRPVSAFGPDKDTSDGLRCWCRTCFNEKKSHIKYAEARKAAARRARQEMTDAEREEHNYVQRLKYAARRAARRAAQHGAQDTQHAEGRPAGG